jgi:hypothetical protein
MEARGHNLNGNKMKGLFAGMLPLSRTLKNKTYLGGILCQAGELKLL